MRLPCSIRVRLTLWYGFTLTVVLTMMGVLVYGTLRHRLSLHHDEPLLAMGRAVEHILNEQEDCHTLTPVQIRTLDQLGKLVLVHEEGGKHQVFYQSPSMASNAMAPAVETIGWDVTPRPTLLTFEHQGVPWRVLSMPYHSKAGRQGVIRLMADLSDIEATLRSLRLALMLLAPAGILCSAIGGYWLAGKALAPVDRVVRRAREIEANNLNQRLPHPGAADEIGTLVDTLNGMIGRLEQSFDAMKRFTADASHELRSPLASLRNTIDVTLERPRTVEAQRAALESMGEDVDRLRKIVEDLLLLARADAGRMIMAREPLRLDELVEAMAEALRPRMDSRAIALKVHIAGPVTLLGDERWLYQLVANLLDNAFKFTPPEGVIQVEVGAEAGRARLEVTDSGPGIPEADLERIFERFHQVDPSRTQSQQQGSGLGLAISAWIAHAHGGSITASNPPGAGARFQVTLPLGER